MEIKSQVYLWMENHKKGKNHDFIVQIFSKFKNSWLLVFSLPTTTRDSLLRSFSDLKGQTELHYVGWAKNQSHYPLITYLIFYKVQFLKKMQGEEGKSI